MNKSVNKSIEGVVVSAKMNETAVVSHDSVKSSKLYNKKFKRTKRIIAHNGENLNKIGDIVKITTIRPMSKNKHYKIIK
ncbi:30S ribosomal protein S17 [Candidatus Berkelbacteria bacterium RIFOXYA2_FULL_43_10]|uniref:30S ribosomal protein S17 n=1 Tax=Candidatus Berkelbacteria bacterium RIFOXYA2_FULL_43_10 TaxID=1797472 RepID=A0A1F5E9T4_9BACT|nr:MAG: 30S ribosomal protein S17 [Candidatus Berkelbacteria bacterium RIFOXYA2_FULL_43_10]